MRKLRHYGVITKVTKPVGGRGSSPRYLSPESMLLTAVPSCLPVSLGFEMRKQLWGKTPRGKGGW